MDWILVAVVGMLLVLGAVFLLTLKRKGGHHETDYYAFFIMGIVWMVIGGGFMLLEDFDFNGLFSIGLIFFILGLANRDKWKKKTFPGKDKMKIILTTLISVGVIATLALYLYSSQPIDYGELLLMGIILVIVALAIIMVFRRVKSLRAGLPSEDEMSRRITHKAGYYSFMAAIWVTLGLSFGNVFWTEDLGGPGLTVSEFAAGVILLTGFAFMLSFFYLSRSGSVD